MDNQEQKRVKDTTQNNTNNITNNPYLIYNPFNILNTNNQHTPNMIYPLFNPFLIPQNLFNPMLNNNADLSKLQYKSVNSSNSLKRTEMINDHDLDNTKQNNNTNNKEKIDNKNKSTKKNNNIKTLEKKTNLILEIMIIMNLNIIHMYIMIIKTNLNFYIVLIN